MGSICSQICNCCEETKVKNTDTQNKKSAIDRTDVWDSKMATNFVVPSNRFKSEEAVHSHMGYRMTDTELGKGAFGVVFEMVRVRDNRLLACKVIDLSTASAEEADDIRLVDLKNEIFTLKKVVHKNIIQLFSAYTINEIKCFIVMEKASEGTLDRMVKPGEPALSEQQLKEYFAQIVSALFVLHTKHGIAHKDLKLSNILVCETPNGHKVVKLSDFGLSRISIKKKVLIRGKRAEGTVFYFSPELLKLYILQQYKKKQKTSEAAAVDISGLGRAVTVDPFPADIFALGICLYKMTNQCHPFNAKDKSLKCLCKLYFDQMKRRYVALQRKDLSDELKDLIDAMFEPDYKKRIDIKEIPGHRWLKGVEDIVFTKT